MLRRTALAAHIRAKRCAPHLVMIAPCGRMNALPGILPDGLLRMFLRRQTKMKNCVMQLAVLLLLAVVAQGAMSKNDTKPNAVSTSASVTASDYSDYDYSDCSSWSYSYYKGYK